MKKIYNILGCSSSNQAAGITELFAKRHPEQYTVF